MKNIILGMEVREFCGGAAMGVSTVPPERKIPSIPSYYSVLNFSKPSKKTSTLSLV